ncbi:uncharacterized protein LOC126678206 isoform X2 [Mercurialis annua]|uniref:uncharacterized protein LOC126678206 isoform X2 n=1 Tax=Mercurialis annua TaxID=3986 RepID=UPI00215E79AF|nr:uncharacterized protein LOC126678206 isoform X2 [Mercurialis annua]
MMAESCVISIKTEPQPEIDWSNELDHVPFLLRRQMLLSSKLINSCSTTNNNNTSSTTLTNGDIKNEFDSQGFPNGKETHEQSMQLQNDETKSSSAVHLVAPHNEVQAGCGIADKCSEKDSACQVTALPDDCIVPEIESHSSQKDSASCTINGNVQIPKLDSEISRDWKDFADDLDHIVLKERQRMLLLSKLLRSEKPVRQETPVELNPIKTTTNIPARRNSMRSSTMLNLAKVKAEPLYSSELHKPGMSAAANLSLNIKSVKSEVNVSAELNRDEVDDMQLQQRMKLQIPEKDSKSNTSDNFQCSGKGFPSVEEGPTVMQATNPIRTSWPRKRKKTATDSIETALEEDAPGLLQVLIEQGVSIDEMKLYGETENDEPIDESFIEDGFADLEAVISKIFFHQSSFLKFGILKCTKGTKPSYCLACLFSLVEQTRYLRFRNWPAEWGWCRDLQSFIFVFERHKSDGTS